MSPVVRKWGRRTIVGASCASIGLMGTMLVVEAFGAVPVVAQAVTSPGTWLDYADRYGLPLTFLAVMIGLGVWATRAVWNFSKPLLTRVVESFLGLLEKQSAFIDTIGTHQSELKALAETGQDGHEETHKKLDAVNENVWFIRNRMEHGKTA